MDKKSIVLLIIAFIILGIAVVFAVWSFNIDQTVANQSQDMSKEIMNKENITKKNIENTVINQEDEEMQEESKTEDFETTYKDFKAEDLKGNEIKLSDYKGKAIVVLFWNNENEDSVEMLKRVNEQYENYKENIEFIAIDTKGQNNNLQEVNIPIYNDKNDEITKLYGIKEVPTIIYINKENEVFNSKTGLTTKDALIANLDILTENF